jgi:hypothetical protein
MKVPLIDWLIIMNNEILSSMIDYQGIYKAIVIDCVC